MNDAQKIALGKFNEAWVVDYNFQNEPIIYTHTKDKGIVEEYVIDSYGNPTHTATYPYTIKLQKELVQYQTKKF